MATLNAIQNRKIVLINQAVNHLSIGFANAFHQQFQYVSVITGSIHEQGEPLEPYIQITKINHWQERPAWKKFGSYFLACAWMWVLLLTKYRKHEVIFVSIPPMAYLLNLLLTNRFSMIIWDVYPDTFAITGMKSTHPVYRIWTWLNRRSFRKTFRLFTISEVMANSLAKYVDREKILVQPLWAIFQENSKLDKAENPFVKEHQLEGKFIVQYSGNIGLTHKVEILIDLAEQMQDHPEILFQIIGRGPRKPYLEKLVRERNLPNCQFLPFQSDEMFPYSLSAADVGAVILDAVTAKGSVPSKSYNLMSYGIPALYIASEDSELHHYTKKYDHARCFNEADLDQAREFILKLKEDEQFYNRLSKNAQQAAQDFKRSNADKFVEKYLEDHATQRHPTV